MVLSNQEYLHLDSPHSTWGRELGMEEQEQYLLDKYLSAKSIRTSKAQDKKNKRKL